MKWFVADFALEGFVWSLLIVNFFLLGLNAKLLNHERKSIKNLVEKNQRAEKLIAELEEMNKEAAYDRTSRRNIASLAEKNY
jgi:hypothetical protein